MDIFVQRLRQAMFLRGWKQVNLKKATGFSDGQISSWYNGKYRPNAQATAKIAAALRVSPEYLVGQEDRIPASLIPEPEEAQNEEERELLEAWRSADEPRKQIVRLALGMTSVS